MTSLTCCHMLSSRQLVGRECFFNQIFLAAFIFLVFPALGCPAGPAMRRNQQDWPMPSTSPSPDRGSPGPGGAPGRLAAWTRKVQTDLPGSSRQSARRLPQSAPPNFFPYHACVRRPPYQSVAAAHEKESKPPAGPRLVALHGARTRLSATGTRRAKGPNLGPILFPVLPWPTTCSSTQEKQSRHEPAGGLLSSARSAASERRADREVPAGVRESGDADCYFFFGQANLASLWLRLVEAALHSWPFFIFYFHDPITPFWCNLFLPCLCRAGAQSSRLRVLLHSAVTSWQFWYAY